MREGTHQDPLTPDIALSEELLNQVAIAARRLRMSHSEVVNAAIHQFLYHSPQHNAVYLSAPVDALMKGCYEENTSISELKKHGNFGLGTFNNLDGEMVMLDGTVYQLKEDGFAHEVSDTVETPFSCVTFFSPTTVEQIDQELDHAAFKNLLDRLIPSENMFFALRIDADFSFIRVWSVPRQEAHRPISEVKPAVFEYHDVKGTLAGFFTPRFIKSLLNPGYHLHFLTDDRRHGGHMDQCRLNRLSIGVQAIPRLELNLPITIDYLTAKLL
ncbi:MAG TPA: acetolactate decarboxylase [Syntrophobacteraceae bacterium]|nr:acetolactate decarboxylase [Syntrophobacteraceae bacterium]